MSKHTDALTEHTLKRLDDELTDETIHTLSRRVLKLESRNAALLNALTRYRVQHDQGMHPSYRPCDCPTCQQAIEAIAAAKGEQ